MQLTINELIRLASSEVEDPQSHIQHVFNWQYEHTMAAAKGFLGFAASLIVAAAIGFAEGKVTVDGWELYLAIAGVLALLAIGVLRFRAAGRVRLEYLAAQRLMAELSRIRPFIERYEADAR